MSGSQDIRAWAQDQGYGVGSRGGIAQWIKDEYEQAHGDGDGVAADGGLGELDGPPLLMVPDSLPDAADAAESPVPPGPPPAERPPVPPPGPRRGLLGGKPRKPREAAGKKAARPRVPLENLIGSGYAFAAMAVMRSPRAVPVGRVMQMQSPLIGYLADDAIKGTAADRFLQPLARMGETGELLAAVAGPPLLVGMISARPELYPALAPMLKMALMSWFQIAGPAAEKMKKRATRLDADLPVTDAELDGIIQALFADIDVGAVPSPDEEANIRRARDNGQPPPA